MPNAVTSSPRWLIFDAILTRLETIRQSAGYQTQPRVSDDERDVVDQKDKHYILLTEGNEDVVEYGAQGLWTMEYELNVYGYAPVSLGRPVKVVNALLQDVRNCICGYSAALSTAVGRGCEIRLGKVDTDQGVLADQGWASFALTISVIYKQTAAW